MESRTNRTVVGVFSTWEKAESAIDDLLDQGFLNSEIGAVTRDADGSTAKRTLERRSPTNVDLDDDGNEDDAATGAITGAAAGVGIGGLIGLGVLSGVIPVIGPALFAGTLGVLASNAAGGAAVAGVIGALMSWGVSEEEAKHYEGEIAAGRVVVTVAAGARSSVARDVLKAHGASIRESGVASNAY